MASRTEYPKMLKGAKIWSGTELWTTIKPISDMKPKYAGSSYAVILMQLKHQNRQTHHLAGQDLECRTHLAIAGLVST